MGFKISLYLDTRRKKDSGVYPLKLQAYDSDTRKQKFIPTIFEFTEEEFQAIWKSEKPSNAFKKMRAELEELIHHSESVAEKIEPFNLEKFKTRVAQKSNVGKSVLFHYEQKIKELTDLERFSSKSGYEYSKKSLSEYSDYKGKSFTQLNFSDITPNWLDGYQEYMDNNGKSKTTIGMYLRPLKAIFNRAIDSGDISREIYPFGNKKKNKYQIPTGTKTKKALTKKQLGILFKSNPDSPHQLKAKEFWLFSYACNGMNIKDIALLTYKDLKKDHFNFFRAKTKNSSTSGKSISVYLNDYTSRIINTYGNEKIESNYIFPILQKGSTKEQQQKDIGNFVKFINQHIKKLAKDLELPEEISTYWARHSFATNSLRNGASMPFIQESLGHGDMKTTMNYFAGFEDETKKDFAATLMNF